MPAPKGDPEAPLQCLIFDSVFNPFRGIIAYFKVVNGVIRKGDHVKFIATGKEYDADEVGVLKLTMSPRDEIRTGDVGYIISGIKTSREVRVGDTITHVARPAKDAIAGFEEVKPMVFAGVYPIDSEDFENLRASLEKLQLNDASLTFQPESSAALGFGFRCGFLGLLHMEIVQERLDREFNMDVITTVPNVSYKVYDKKGNCTEVHNPGGLPDPTLIDHIDEPYIRASVITNTTFIGPIMTLCLGKRGILIKQEYISGDRVEIHYDMPLGEIVIDFYDKLKSISKGYASFDYHIHDFRPSKLVKLDILLNGEPVDALSTLTHMDNSVAFGRRMCEKLKELIPRQQFDIAIQAAIGAKIIARETIKAVRKDVTAKCYGGDISRKRKLLEKQKEGKKRMKQIGTVEVPQKAFLAVLKLETHPFLLPWIGFLILSFQNPCILEVWSVFCFDCIAAVRSIGFVIETGDDHTKHTLFVFSQNSVISVVLHTFFQSVSICFVLETADNDTVTFQSACIFTLCSINSFCACTDVGSSRFRNRSYLFNYFLFFDHLDRSCRFFFFCLFVSSLIRTLFRFTRT